MLTTAQHHRAAGTVGKTDAHIQRVRSAQARERAKDSARSPKWASFRRKFLAQHKAKGLGCEACGAKIGLQLHHVRPFHTIPSLELDPRNMLVLCMFVGGLECHEMIGHSRRGFSWVNPDSRQDAQELSTHPERLAEIRARAAKRAIRNAPEVG